MVVFHKTTIFVNGAAFSGRLFLFSEDKANRHREYPERKKGTHQSLTTRIELTGKGSDRFCTAGKVGPFRFREKSSSLRSGIFPENLASPEAAAVPPL